jgi:multidrug efflux pump subunit AcrA (membrane-fusion protein)
VDGFGEQTFEGRVERINPQATAGAGVVPVYVIVTNPGQVLRVGLFAHGELVLSAGEPRITVPASALHERDGEQFVFAIENSQLVRKPVRVAFTTDSRAVIAEGLTEGATVVAVNLGLLPEGAQVNPVAAGQS